MTMDRPLSSMKPTTATASGGFLFKSTSMTNYAAKKMIDMKDKNVRKYWMRRWGVSYAQLRAAVHNTNSHEVKKIREYLKHRGRFSDPSPVSPYW
jgi:hypothetical protein